jgi:chromosome segregation ATPase
MSNTLLEAMITNLGVDVPPNIKTHLKTIPFTTYPDNLQTADKNIGATLKSPDDTNLKIELLKLQVHYLHNLDAVNRAETEKKNAAAVREQNKALINELRETQAQLLKKTDQLSEVHTQSSNALINARSELDKARRQITDGDAGLEALKTKCAALKTKYDALQAKVKVLTNMPSLHLSHQSHPKQELDELMHVLNLNLKKDAKFKFLSYETFISMINYIKHHKEKIENLLKPIKNITKSTSDTHYTLTIADVSKSTGVKDGKLTIDIDIGNDKYSIKYYDSAKTVIIADNTETVDESNESVYGSNAYFQTNSAAFNKSYTAINDLLHIINPLSQNKYLKYKNKYLQLKKLYNL